MRVAQSALDHFARLDLRGHPSALDACITLGLAASEQSLAVEVSAASHLADCLNATERELVSGDPRTTRLRQLSGGLTPAS